MRAAVSNQCSQAERGRLSPELVYRHFLSAIQTCDYSRMADLVTEGFLARLKCMRSLVDFDVLFGLWSDSYAKAYIRRQEIQQNVAVIDVAFGRLSNFRLARITLRFANNRWLVEDEQFVSPAGTCLFGSQLILSEPTTARCLAGFVSERTASIG